MFETWCNFVTTKIARVHGPLVKCKLWGGENEFRSTLWPRLRRMKTSRTMVLTGTGVAGDGGGEAHLAFVSIPVFFYPTTTPHSVAIYAMNWRSFDSTMINIFAFYNWDITELIPAQNICSRRCRNAPEPAGNIESKRSRDSYDLGRGNILTFKCL